MAQDDPEDPRANDDRYQRNGATTLFWILVAVLAIIGACVLISLLLVLIYGS